MTQIRTEGRCKICNNPNRTEIERLYVLGKKGHVAEDGKIPTQIRIMAMAPAKWGMVLNTSNMRAHFQKHFDMDAKPMEGAQEVLDAATHLRKLIDEGGLEMVAPDNYLKLMVALGYQKLLNNPEKITNQDVLKAIDSLTRRHHDETQAKLMQALGEGVKAALGSAGPTPRAIEPAPEVLEAVDVEEVQPPGEQTPRQIDDAGA